MTVLIPCVAAITMLSIVGEERGAVAESSGALTRGEAPEDGSQGSPDGGETSEVRADRLRAAVLPVATEGSIPSADLALLEERLLEGLGRGGFDLVGPDTVKASGDSSGACDSKACAVSVGTAFSATHVVRAKVTLVDRDYRIDVSLADVAAGGDEIASASEGCEICGVMEAAALMETSAAVLRSKLDALNLGPTMLEVRSDPEGAVVRVDGEIVGTTPLQRALPSGKHRVRVEATGYISLEREVVFVEGATETIDLSMEPLPSVLPPARWGWGALSVGIVALGGGAALTWLDRRPQQFRCAVSDGSKDADGDCEFLWNTRWFGAGTLIAGSAMVTLGAVILLDARLRSKPKQEAAWRSSPRRPRVSVGPRGVAIFGRF